MQEIWNFNYIEILIWLFFTYSFAGWIMESIGGIFVVKKFVNRGFMIGPLCPVYGVGVVIITLFLGKYANDFIALFVLATVLCGILEYLTSYVMEKLFNARWWDYKNRKFNINGRICLENLCLFGIAGTVILRYINPFFIDLYMKVPENYRHIITAILLVLYVIDFIISFIIIFSFKGATYANMDNTEEITSKVKDKAEDIIMQTESDVRHSIRKLKLKSQRRIRYRRSKLLNSRNYSLRELINKINEDRTVLKERIAEEKIRFDELMKEKKVNFENKQKEYIGNKIQKARNDIEKVEEKIKNIKVYSEEFSKQVKEKFGEESFLKRRLMNAFPDMKISKPKEKNRKK